MSISNVFSCSDTADIEIYTLSLHDALPICSGRLVAGEGAWTLYNTVISQQNERAVVLDMTGVNRSEEHTSELQSHSDLVCRLLLEKKKYISKLRINCMPNIIRPVRQSIYSI